MIAGGIIAWALPSIIVGVAAATIIVSFGIMWLLPLWSLRRTSVLEELQEVKMSFETDGLYDDAARVRDELERVHRIILSAAPRLEAPKQPDSAGPEGD